MREPSDSTASLRKTAQGLVSTIIRRVNVTNEISLSTEVDKAVAALTGVIEQYKLVAASHGSKKKSPEPTPETAS